MRAKTRSTRGTHREIGITPKRRRRLIAAIRKRDGTSCWICGRPCRDEETTLDHVVPKSKGGGNGLTNLRIAHQCCNNRRGNEDA
jgi:5-methylcytosine-specific restriction endonuclease McrA